MGMSQQTAEGAVAVSKTATAFTYGGAGGAVVSGAADTLLGMSPGEWSIVGVIGGLVIALLGFAVNVYFKHQHLVIAMKNARANPDE